MKLGFAWLAFISVSVISQTVLPQALRANEGCTSCGPPGPEITRRQIENLNLTAVRIAYDPATEPLTVHENFSFATKGQLEKGRIPVRHLEVKTAKNQGGLEKFPVFGKSTAVFYRAAVIEEGVDKSILKDGWKSGYSRGLSGSALPPTASLEARAMEYARIKGDPRPFPKNASVVGVIKEDPIRTASIVYHTGYDAHAANPKTYIRVDEIELGPGAEKPECRDVKMVDTTEAFRKAGKKSRYSTEGEFAVDMEIPPSCVVAVYRIRFQKVDDKYYTERY